MNRNESFPASGIHTLAAHLAWASLEMMVDDVEDFQVLISGDANDVNDLKLQCNDGRLLVEQPTYGLTIKLHTERWMQIFIRIPRAWKGAVDANTITAPLKVRGLSGTDLTLDTVSGDLRATSLSSIATALRTVSGDIRADGLTGEKLGLRTVSGNMTVSGCGFDEYRLGTVSGEVSIEMVRPFEKLDGTTVSGDVRLYAPVNRVDAALRAVSGRLRTSGVSIQEDAPRAYLSSVSGNLEINCSLQAAANEEE